MVHGGQALGTTPEGKRAFIWNALPGELVRAELHKNRNRYFEGVALEILEPSADRILPKDEAYLSTSPWQMMSFAAENRFKQQILLETMQREHVMGLPNEIQFHSGEQEWQYRNKMEYSFWGDDDGLHLALFHRGSHGKRIVQGSSIAMPLVDDTANKILKILQTQSIRAAQLKTVMVRANQDGRAAAVLFVRDLNFPDIQALKDVCQGVSVYYSDPKSPASVTTKLLYTYGDTVLRDTIRNSEIQYDALSFLQVNLGIFNLAIDRIASITENFDQVVDMYAGVGTIGLSIGTGNVIVETDVHNCKLARLNASGGKGTVVESAAEKALEYIDADKILVVDPPRAGLHHAVTDRILEVAPPAVIYLSCNPITHARDIARLQDRYVLESLEGYNFFPRTPHIEGLAILRRR